MAQDRLQAERETYLQHLPMLLPQEGKYALVIGHDLVGVFPDYETALAAGYEKAGLGRPFLVERISRIEPVVYLSRDPECLISQSA